MVDGTVIGLLSATVGDFSVFGMGTVLAFIIHGGKDVIFATMFDSISTRIFGSIFSSAKVIPSIPGAELS